MSALAGQLSFDALLDAAAHDNVARERERQFGDLPGTLREAVPYYRGLIARHHALMVGGFYDEAMAVRSEAHRLAQKLNGYEPGIIAGPDAPGCVLERVARAPKGMVPQWGQKGSFELNVGGMRVRVAIDGMFGIGACYSRWPGFRSFAVVQDEPFLSETGFRCFLGIHADLPFGQTPESFVRAVIEAHVKRVLKGRLLSIKPRFRSNAASAL